LLQVKFMIDNWQGKEKKEKKEKKKKENKKISITVKN
jgi:hypothetical protein